MSDHHPLLFLPAHNKHGLLQQPPRLQIEQRTEPSVIPLCEPLRLPLVLLGLMHYPEHPIKLSQLELYLGLDKGGVSRDGLRETLKEFVE